MARIEVLDPLVADQIAAGEVVERPGSVVKELIENSLDAGADSIQLHVQGGGTVRIRVVDNGSGIPADQIDAALQRHATSKITRLSDLDEIATFGFRGEALPSIAAVSKVTLRTRTAGQVAGQLLVVEGALVKERREVGCPEGMDIEVRDLFYNTPARLKFLKKETTEAGHCAEALVRLALVHPQVAFKMTVDGRPKRQLPRVEKSEERVAGLFGNEPLARAQGERGGVQVLAILGPPDRARAGAGSLYTYVNGRFVRDRALLKAVTQAFGGTLEPGRYPVGAIALGLPPGSFDVNVHPQKTEVRFADPSGVFRALSAVVGEMVARSVWTFGSREPSAVAETGRELERRELTPAPRPYRPAGRLVPRPAAPPRSGPKPPRAEVKRPDPPFKTPAQSPDLLSRGAEIPGPLDGLEYIGQARGLFLLFEGEKDLVIIDQHAAHERITYERLIAQYKRGRIPSQQLLVPHTVDLGPADADRIADLRSDLLRLGLDVTRSGPDRVSIRAVPVEVVDASPDRLLADMVLALEQGRPDSGGESAERLMAAMACHGSLRAGRSVSPSEARALLGQMGTIDFAGHCPHGRPVLARIPWREVMRRVGRS